MTRKWGKSSSFQLSDTDGRGSVQLVQLLYRTECNKLKQVVCVEHDFSCAFSNVCIEKRLFLVRKLEISVILWLSSENLSWVILLLRNASFTCTFSLTVTYHETAHQPASDRLASHNTEPEVPNFFFFFNGWVTDLGSLQLKVFSKLLRFFVLCLKIFASQLFKQSKVVSRVTLVGLYMSTWSQSDQIFPIRHLPLSWYLIGFVFLSFFFLVFTNFGLKQICGVQLMFRSQVWTNLGCSLTATCNICSFYCIFFKQSAVSKAWSQRARMVRNFPTREVWTCGELISIVFNANNTGTNDAFVTIGLGKEKFQTSVKQKASPDLEWNEECEL